MIQMSHILREASSQEIEVLLDKIKEKQFTFFNKGDNGRIYEIDGTDYLFKITTELDEYRCAAVIVNNYSKFSTFIPVYYVDGKRMYIMSKAAELSGSQRQQLDQFYSACTNNGNNQPAVNRVCLILQKLTLLMKQIRNLSILLTHLKRMFVKLRFLNLT
jgi:hypothetical protein